MEWIFKAEQFFEYHNTPYVDRLVIASIHLDHNVISWFKRIQRTHPFRSWQEFTRALELDYGPSAYECPRSTLFKLQQTGTVTVLSRVHFSCQQGVWVEYSSFP